MDPRQYAEIKRYTAEKLAKEQAAQAEQSTQAEQAGAA
jgi:hypothetical protein